MLSLLSMSENVIFNNTLFIHFIHILDTIRRFLTYFELF